MNFREINTQHYVDLVQRILDEMDSHFVQRPDGCVCNYCCELRSKRYYNHPGSSIRDIINEHYTDEDRRKVLKGLRGITEKRCSQSPKSYIGTKPTQPRF